MKSSQAANVTKKKKNVLFSAGSVEKALEQHSDKKHGLIKIRGGVVKRIKKGGKK